MKGEDININKNAVFSAWFRIEYIFYNLGHRLFKYISLFIYSY